MKWLSRKRRNASSTGNVDKDDGDKRITALLRDLVVPALGLGPIDRPLPSPTQVAGATCGGTTPTQPMVHGCIVEEGTSRSASPAQLPRPADLIVDPRSDLDVDGFSENGTNTSQRVVSGHLSNPTVSDRSSATGRKPGLGNQTVEQDSILRFYLNIATAFRWRGERDKAKDVYEQITKKLSIPPSNHIIIRCNIAEILLQEGRFKDAEDLLTELEGSAGPGCPTNINTALDIRRLLGATFDKRGRYREAVEKLEEAAMEAAKTLSTGTTSVDYELLSIRDALVVAMGHIGDYDQAIKLNDQVLKGAQKALDDTKKEIEESTSEVEGLTREKATFQPGKRGAGDEIPNIENQASNQVELKMITDKVKAMTDKINLGNSELVRLSSKLAEAQAHRAYILTYQGQYDEAHKYNEEALTNIEEKLGAKHVATLDCWSLKAQLLANDGKLREAEEQCQRTLRRMRRELGHEHPSTLRTLSILVSIYKARAVLPGAAYTAECVLERNKRNQDLGLDHPQTISSMADLASVYSACGKMRKAESLQKEVVTAAERRLGVDHPLTLGYRLDLATILCKAGEPMRARTISSEVLSKLPDIFFAKRQTTSQHAELMSEPAQSKHDFDEQIRTTLTFLDAQKQCDYDIHPTFPTALHCLGMSERAIRAIGALELSEQLLSKALE